MSQPEPKAVPTVDEMFSLAQAGGSFTWFNGLLPDPDTVLEKLGKSSAETFYSLLADPRVGAAIESRKAATLSRELLIQPGGDGGKAETKAADEAREMITAWGRGAGGGISDGGLNRVISEILDAPYWGMAPMEVLWEQDARRWRISNIVGRPAWWFKFDSQDSQPRFVGQGGAVSIEGEPIPAYKLLLPRHNPSHYNPYGQRLLSRLFWPVTFKRGGWRNWVEFMLKFGDGMIAGQAPAGWTKEQRDAYAVELALAKSRSALVYPEGGKVEILGDNNRKDSGDVHQNFKDACNADIVVVILGGTLTQEITGNGSRAAATVHDEVREDLAERDEELVIDTLNDGLDWWSKLNYGDQVAPPVAKFHQEEDLKSDTADRDETLTRQGVKFKKSYYVKTYNLEEDDFDLSEASAEAPAGPQKLAQDEPADLVKLASDAPKSDPKPDPKPDDTPEIPADIRRWLSDRDADVAGLIDSAVEALPGGEIFGPVADLVDSIDSLDGAAETVLNAWSTIDLSRLETALTEGIFAADCYARWAVGQEIDGSAKLAAGSSVQLKSLPMTEAVEYWRGKTPLKPGQYAKLPDEAKARAFAVSGIAKADVLGHVHGQIASALENGDSLADFKRNCKDSLVAQGWLTKDDLTKTGRIRSRAGRRLDNIYRTNVLTAYSVGRYAQMTDPAVIKSAGNWMYVDVDDDRTRPAHRAMGGRVFRADDPIWDQWYPPNGYRCRCTVIALTDGQLKKRGLKVQQGGTIGEVLHPDPSWTHNPGKAAFGGLVEGQVKQYDQWQEWPYKLPGPENNRLPAAKNLKKLDPAPKLLPDNAALKARGMSSTKIAQYYDAEAIKALGLEEKHGFERTVHAPDGQELIVSRKFWGGGGKRSKITKGERGRYIPIWKKTLEKPDEIWLTPMVEKDTGKVILRRHHLTYWRGADGNVGGYGVMEFDRDNICTGVSMYDVQADQTHPKTGLNLLDDHYRRGVLLHGGRGKRKEPKK